jgi:uncharacterized membrane protein
MNNPTPTAAVPSQSYERWISKTLRIGVGLSTILMVGGLTIAALQDTPVAVPLVNPSLVELFARLVTGSFANTVAVTMMYTGLFLLMLTPFMRVAATTISFSLLRDWRFVSVSLLVLVMLVGQLVLSLTISTPGHTP